MTGSFERIEVITGVAPRRRWSVEEKVRMVAESLRAGASVSLVARRHGLRSNQLFKWREDGAGGREHSARLRRVHRSYWSASSGMVRRRRYGQGPSRPSAEVPGYVLGRYIEVNKEIMQAVELV